VIKILSSLDQQDKGGGRKESVVKRIKLYYTHTNEDIIMKPTKYFLKRGGEERG
jgi:hypothetical protein